MKLTIRAKYMIWLMGYTVFCLVFNFSLDLFHDFWVGEFKKPDIIWHESVELMIFLVGNTIAFPLILLLGWLIARRMLKPVNSIAETARKISEGHIKTRIKVQQPEDELGKLAKTINQAFDRYDELVSRLQRFGGNAAHQLRTPLTALRSQGEICLKKNREPEEYRATIQDMMVRLDHLSHIVEKLLALSKLETSAWDEHLSPLDFLEVMRTTIEEFKPSCEEKGIDLQIQADEGLWVCGDKELLGQMFANLMDNAIRYTPKNGMIRWTVSPSPDRALRCVVEDSGPGIPEDLRSQVFEPFHQGANPDAFGTGLGLAIVAEIVRLHRGRVSAGTSEWKGAQIEVIIPQASHLAHSQPPLSRVLTSSK